MPQDEKLILVGGGIGVTSLISLASSFDEKNITFIYTVKQGKDILYTDVLENLQKKHNIKIYAKIGRYSNEQLEDILPIDENCSYIIAGPTAMNSAYKKYLTQKGIKSNKIFFESFAF